MTTRLNLDNVVVRAAYDLAATAHSQQVRRYSGDPYFTHCLEVAELVQSAVGCTPDMVAAALCHDVIEDTKYHEDAVRAVIGSKATSLVKQVTKPHFRGKKLRAEKQAIILRHLKLATPRAQTIKYCDILSNISGLVDLDPEFARIYLPEKRVQLQEMHLGDERLRERANAALKNEEAALRLIDQTAQVAEVTQQYEEEKGLADLDMEELPGWGQF